MQSAAYVRTLTKAGVDLATAQAHAEALEDVLTDKFVTRDHFDGRMAQIDARFAQVDARFDQMDAKIDRLEARLEAKIDTTFLALDAKIDTKVSMLETKISEASSMTVRWMVGQSLGLAALIITAMKFVK